MIRIRYTSMGTMYEWLDDIRPPPNDTVFDRSWLHLSQHRMAKVRQTKDGYTIIGHTTTRQHFLDIARNAGLVIYGFTIALGTIWCLSRLLPECLVTHVCK